MVLVGNMLNGTFTGSSTTVTTTATAIPSSNATDRRSIILKNEGAVTVYLGGSAVTSSTGFPLEAGDTLPLDLGNDIILYGITASGSADVRTLEGS